MKVLLTGGSGFIGKNLIKQLSKNHNITAILRPTSKISEISSFCKIYHYDGDLNKLISLFKKEKFNTIIHLATCYKPSHTPDDISEIIQANITLGVCILEAIKQNKLPCIFINTITFSQFAKPPSYSPASLYDSTKQAFLDIIKYYSTEMPFCFFSNLMLYNTYGHNDPRPKIFNLWNQSLKNNISIEMSNGDQLLDFSHIDDVINGFEILINLCIKKEIDNNSIFTLQNQRYSLKELEEFFSQIKNKKIPIIWGAKPYRTNEIFDPISEQNSNFSKLPKWQPKISIKEGIKIVYGK